MKKRSECRSEGTTELALLNCGDSNPVTECVIHDAGGVGADRIPLADSPFDDEAGVDGQRNTGDVTCRIGHQPQHCISDIVWFQHLYR